ncbi:hypothetical protein ACHAPJ_011263 [Fusarium lateritium]
MAGPHQNNNRGNYQPKPYNGGRPMLQRLEKEKRDRAEKLLTELGKLGVDLDQGVQSRRPDTRDNSNRGGASNRGGNHHGNDRETGSVSGRGRSASRNDQGNASGFGRDGGASRSGGRNNGGRRDASVAGFSGGGKGQSTIAFAGVSKSQGKKKPYKPKPSGLLKPTPVPEAELRVYTNSQGMQRTQAVNTSVHGGVSTNFSTTTVNGGFLGQGNSRSDLNALGADIMANPENTGFTYTLEPTKRDAHKFIRQADVQLRVITSSGRTKDGKIAALEEASRSVKVISESQGTGCALCSRRTHGLEDCLVARKGDIAGCPLCNKDNHLVDQCSKFLRLSLEDKVDVLVSRRAYMPALRTKEPWYNWLLNFMNSEESKAKEAKIPQGFPWSKSYAMDMACKDDCRAIEALQKEYDESEQKDCLPECPSTSSFEAIWETYWHPQKRIRPRFLDDLVMAADDDYPALAANDPRGEESVTEGLLQSGSTASNAGNAQGFDHDMDTA